MLYQRLIRPLLFQMDAEQAHHLVGKLALLFAPCWPLLPGLFKYDGCDLKVNLCGIKLDNPVGLAAGFDKNGELVAMLGSFGFGFAEIGSVTARACTGNPPPRLFRLPADEAVINRMGLNGDGADLVAARLSAGSFSLPVGLNIAKTNNPAITGDAAIEDILYTYRKVKDLPVSYITVNASCPNSSDGIIEETRELAAIFAETARDNPRRLPLFVKLSPDSSTELVEDIVQCATAGGVSGFICGNTSISREGLLSDKSKVMRIGAGGLSGRPLKPLALKLCRLVAKLKAPNQAIIASGGISSGQDAYEFIAAGAAAVQIYTGLVYHGPGLARLINRQLSDLLARDGLTLSEAIGCENAGQS